MVTCTFGLNNGSPTSLVLLSSVQKALFTALRILAVYISHSFILHRNIILHTSLPSSYKRRLGKKMRVLSRIVFWEVITMVIMALVFPLFFYLLSVNIFLTIAATVLVLLSLDDMVFTFLVTVEFLKPLLAMHRAVLPFEKYGIDDIESGGSSALLNYSVEHEPVARKLVRRMSMLAVGQLPSTNMRSSQLETRRGSSRSALELPSSDKDDARILSSLLGCLLNMVSQIWVSSTIICLYLGVVNASHLDLNLVFALESILGDIAMLLICQMYRKFYPSHCCTCGPME